MLSAVNVDGLMVGVLVAMATFITWLCFTVKVTISLCTNYAEHCQQLPLIVIKSEQKLVFYTHLHVLFIYFNRFIVMCNAETAANALVM